MNKYLCCVAEKNTKKQLSDCYEFEVYFFGELFSKLKEETGIDIDGVSNYLDYMEV